MNIVTISASPTEKSRSGFLVQELERDIRATGKNIAIESWNLGDFDPRALVYTDFSDHRIAKFQASISKADAVIFATPVYKASYSGGLKLLLDIIPENGLKDKVALTVATGGTNAHLLVLDYILKPVLSVLGSRIQLSGIYVSDYDLKKDSLNNYTLTDALDTRLKNTTRELLELIEEKANTKEKNQSKLSSYSDAVAKHSLVYY